MKRGGGKEIDIGSAFFHRRQLVMFCLPFSRASCANLCFANEYLCFHSLPALLCMILNAKRVGGKKSVPLIYVDVCAEPIFVEVGVCKERALRANALVYKQLCPSPGDFTPVEKS